jgi:acyl carrier protein
VNTPTHDRDAARAAVEQAIRRVVPDADLPADDVPLRRELELDSLDFLSFVETLAKLSHRRIDEIDYPELATVGSCVDFLTTTPEKG